MLNRIFLFLNCGAVRVRGLQKRTNASSQDLQRHVLVDLWVRRGWIARPDFPDVSARLRSTPKPPADFQVFPVIPPPGSTTTQGNPSRIQWHLSKAGWSLGYVSVVDCEGRTIWIADAHRGDGKRFVVRADEKLTAFLELQAAIRDGIKLSCKPF